MARTKKATADLFREAGLDPKIKGKLVFTRMRRFEIIGVDVTDKGNPQVLLTTLDGKQTITLGPDNVRMLLAPTAGL